MKIIKKKTIIWIMKINKQKIVLIINKKISQIKMMKMMTWIFNFLKLKKSKKKTRLTNNDR